MKTNIAIKRIVKSASMTDTPEKRLIFALICIAIDDFYGLVAGEEKQEIKDYYQNDAKKFLIDYKCQGLAGYIDLDPDYLIEHLEKYPVLSSL